MAYAYSRRFLGIYYEAGTWRVTVPAGKIWVVKAVDSWMGWATPTEVTARFEPGGLFIYAQRLQDGHDPAFHYWGMAVGNPGDKLALTHTALASTQISGYELGVAAYAMTLPQEGELIVESELPTA